MKKLLAATLLSAAAAGAAVAEPVQPLNTTKSTFDLGGDSLGDSLQLGTMNASAAIVGGAILLSIAIIASQDDNNSTTTTTN